jgi:hypothetical protein
MYGQTFVSICLSLFLIQAGCATASITPAPADEVQSGFGTIGVVNGRSTPKVRFEGPEPMEGAGDAAARMAGRVLGGLWLACGQLALATAPTVIGPAIIGVGCVAATPFAAIGGAAGGGLTSSAAKANRHARKARRAEARALRSVIDPALEAVASENPLHARLLERLPARTQSTVISVTETGRLRYKDLSSQGIDTVLKATVLRLDVAFDNTFVLTAKVRLIRLADREELYADTHTFKIAASRWTADEGKAVRAALMNGYQALADKIVDELFREATVATRSNPR